MDRVRSTEGRVSTKKGSLMSAKLYLAGARLCLVCACMAFCAAFLATSRVLRADERIQPTHSTLAPNSCLNCEVVKFPIEYCEGPTYWPNCAVTPACWYCVCDWNELGRPFCQAP